MLKTTKSMRLHLGIFGKTNVGKSSFLNRLTNQSISIVSEIAGTTTDVVEKSMEFLPIGPITILDTAGIDDVTALSNLRIEKTMKIINRTDVAVIITDSSGFDDYEVNLIEKFNELNIPFIAVINKSDLEKISNEKLDYIKGFTKNILTTSTLEDKDLVINFKSLLINLLPEDFINPPKILGDLVPEKSTVILVIPIDKEAPKGRIILPQVQTLRDMLDSQCISIVVTEKELQEALDALKTPPAAVVTDSQAFAEVSAIVPEGIYLTSFSMLFARLKGNLDEFVKGAEAIEKLQPNDKVLILESCTHHQIEDDIARVKIPRWLKQKLGFDVDFEYYSGHDFPEIDKYKLIIHCGACMTNRREMLSRILIASNKNVPITNYGVLISYCLGILPRAMGIFKQ